MASSSSPPPLDPHPTSAQEPQPLSSITSQVLPNGKASANGDAPEPPHDKASTESRIEDMQDKYKQGRSYYLAADYGAAAEHLSRATQLGVSIYGDFAPELFNSYLYYGKTLVELSREDTMSHLVKPPGVQDEASDSDEEEPEEGSAGDDAKQHTGLAKNGDKPEASEGKEENEEEPSDGETLGEEEENASLAWEVLEMARTICEKQELTPEWLLNKSDVHVALANALVVFENFDKAREEFKEALKIQTEHLEPNDRKIAETLFSIGLSHRGQADFVSAAEWFEKAGEVLEKRIDSLKAELEAGNLGEQNQKTATSDLEDAKQVAETIDTEAKDARESAEAQRKMMEVVRAEQQRLQAAGQGTSAELPANDITSMVRKRKQPTATDQSGSMDTASEQKDAVDVSGKGDDDGDAKKTRLEKAENGSEKAGVNDSEKVDNVL